MQLRERLEAVQAENAELYSRLSLLRKQSKHVKQEDQIVNSGEIAEQLEQMKKQLEQAEGNRTRAKSHLSKLTAMLQQLQSTLDKENLEIEHEMAKAVQEKEVKLKSHFEKVLDRCKHLPQFGKIESLVGEIQQKQRQMYKYQEEINRITNTIASPPSEEDANLVFSRESIESLASDEIEVDPDLDSSPLPCIYNHTPSLRIARTRRRLSFQPFCGSMP